MQHTLANNVGKLDNDLHILYVEDSEIVRESTHELLKEFFPSIDLAVDGEEGLAKYEAYYNKFGVSYDIVFTDINMPCMNGIEMSRQILKQHPLQNIVIISAHNEVDYLLSSINLGISNFVLKPIEILPFQNIISRLIHSIQNEKKLKQKQKEIVKMNALLQRAKQRAEEASLNKSQFLAHMSHEIRTPLNAVVGFISVLKEMEKDPLKQRYLSIINNASDTLLEIISDLLDVSKIESGKMLLKNETFSPFDTLFLTGELFQAQAQEAGVVLNIVYKKSLPKHLYGDIVKIKQIFSNLLSNAIKFTPKKAKVKCVVAYKKGNLIIRVKDQGIGISKERQSTIFEPFIQADLPTEKKYRGTGLGLTICQQLTQHMQGTLTLKSTEGKGSTFTLTLPLPSVESKQSPKYETLSDSVLMDKHILIVEDSQTSSMFLSILLENVGIRCDIVENGLEAIEKFLHNKYDLILMDENMPKLSGIDAAKEIIAIEKDSGLRHTPIVALTAHVLSDDKTRFLQAGMDDYLAKPIEAETLKRCLKRFLT